MFISITGRISRKLLIAKNKILLSILSMALNRYQIKNDILKKSRDSGSTWISVETNEEKTLKQFRMILKRRLEELLRIQASAERSKGRGMK
jgi:hypothetical protein